MAEAADCYLHVIKVYLTLSMPAKKLTPDSVDGSVNHRLLTSDHDVGRSTLPNMWATSNACRRLLTVSSATTSARYVLKTKCLQVARVLSTTAEQSLFKPLDTFSDRHIGPNAAEAQTMLTKIGYESMDGFINASVPRTIRVKDTSVDNKVIPSLSESELLKRARVFAEANKSFKSYIGMGYHNAVVPPVILRNVRKPPPPIQKPL